MKKQKGKIECKAEINETIPQPLAKEEKQKKKKKQINKRAEKFFKLLQNKRKQKQTLNEIEEEIRILTNNPNSTKIDKETIKKKKSALHSVKYKIKIIEEQINSRYGDLMKLAKSPWICGLSLLLKKIIR